MKKKKKKKKKKKYERTIKIEKDTHRVRVSFHRFNMYNNTKKLTRITPTAVFI